jgi:hypothetical protein
MIARPVHGCMRPVQSCCGGGSASAALTLRLADGCLFAQSHFCCPVGFPCRARRGAVRLDTMRGGIGLVRWLAGTLAAASCSITSFSAYSPPLPTRPPTCLPMHVWAYGIQHWASRLTDGEEADRSSGRPSQALRTAGGATAVQHGTTCCNPYKMVRHRASQGKLSESEARRIFQQIIAGIDYCHQASMAPAQPGIVYCHHASGCERMHDGNPMQPMRNAPFGSSGADHCHQCCPDSRRCSPRG